MKKLNNEEMMEINGGVSKWFWAIAGGAIAFVIGVINGITNPLKCNQLGGVENVNK